MRKLRLKNINHLPKVTQLENCRVKFDSKTYTLNYLWKDIPAIGTQSGYFKPKQLHLELFVKANRNYEISECTIRTDELYILCFTLEVLIQWSKYSVFNKWC